MNPSQPPRDLYSFDCGHEYSVAWIVSCCFMLMQQTHYAATDSTLINTVAAEGREMTVMSYYLL